jgi:ABC-type sugar transport system substrate-binding protein
VAFIAVFPTNPYVSNSYEAAKAEAQKHNITTDLVGVASADPQAEYAAIENAATKDAYDGYIILPQNGVSDIPAVKKLVATNKPVVGASIALGGDLCTEKPQVEGMAGVAITPVCQVAENFKQLTIDSCKGLSPCNILWITGLPGFQSEERFLDGVKDAVKEIPGAKLIESSPTQYDSNTTRNVVTNALNANKDINVVWASAPQLYLGAVPAIKESGLKNIRLATDGGTAPQLQAVKDGTVTGMVMGNGLPRSDSTEAMKIMAKALEDPSYRGVGVNVLKETGLPPIFTKDNQSEWADFEPQWSAG